MKSKKNQRLLALILSMVLMLSASISAMAEGDVQTEASGTETTENQAAVQSLEEETVPETEALTEETDTQSTEILEEPVQESAEQEITEEPAENTETPAETTEPVQEETGEPAETTETDQTIVQSPEVQEESAVTEEQPAETTEEVITEETAVSEAAELKQEFTDENGKVTQTITAYVPEGAFQATADQISMEVSFLNTSDTDYIKGMMEELLPENYYLDGYVLYQIDFKVDGEITQPAKAVTITMSGNDLAVEDTQKAHVFYYDPENPEVEGDKDQLAEVIQKDQLIKSLQESGQSTGNIEDYDYSEIAVNDGNADTITVKGWESTIYGCYVEKEAEPVTLEGSAEDIHVTLTGPASSFPEEGELTLSVKEVNKKTDKLAEKAVEEQAEKEDLEVVNYTALDITILKGGEEIQPLGPVNVTFTKEEKEKSPDIKPDQIKVFHVDEETGKAQDMEATESEEGKVEIETDHFSVYVVVDLDQLGGQIDLTVQHWATIKVLDGVDGQDGLDGIEGPNNTRFDNNVELKTKDEFCQIYTDDVIKLDNKLNKNVEELSKVLLADANSEIKNYVLKEIWVLVDEDTADTEDSDITIKKDEEGNNWAVYTLNDPEKTVTLNKDSTIRMIYEPVKKDDALVQDVTFYDYDVTDGKIYNSNGAEDSYGEWLNTTNQGINSTSNYTGGDASNRLAVGQASAFVDHSYNEAKVPDNNNLLNRSEKGDNLKAKEGIVTGINQNGPIYNGVFDAGLFNNDKKIGKTILNNYDLVFNQNGDTYTLTSVIKDGKFDSPTSENLERLTDVYDVYNEDDSTKSKQIFSNNFWPLDQEDRQGQDPLMGAYSEQWKSLNNKLSSAASDDGSEHNWFFGMRYSFEFTLGDYTGPLNFYFRGDDDFWLFVDGKLTTDLGGIHSSIGEILDLTSHVMNDPSQGATEEEKNATHKIEIVYAERGAYGSTCYMQFTLPNVKPVTFDTTTEKTTVTVNKVWNDHNNPNRPASISVELWYTLENKNDWKKYDTQTLSSQNNWTYTWNNIPKDGYQYKVKEVGEENGEFGNYTVTYSGKDGLLIKNSDDSTFSGTITNTASPSTWITVNKVWEDNGSGERPEQVEFYLFYRQEGETAWKEYPNGRLTLTNKNEAAGNADIWTGKYENLPVYLGNTNDFLEYTVMEVEGNTPLEQGDKLNGKNTEDLYTVTYPDNHFGTDSPWTAYKAKKNLETLNLTVTNSYGVKPIPIDLKKYGSDEYKTPRDGAVFSLFEGTLESSDPMKISWSDTAMTKYENITVENTDGENELTTLTSGYYMLKEVTAPVGYELLDEAIYFQIDKGKVKLITQNGSEITDNETEMWKLEVENGTVVLKIKNKALYELPSAGGSGIFLYMIGGTLLLMAGSLMIYINRRRGVLRR